MKQWGDVRQDRCGCLVRVIVSYAGDWVFADLAVLQPRADCDVFSARLSRTGGGEGFIRKMCRRSSSADGLGAVG